MALAAGVMSITLEFAKDLKDRDWFCRMDPYCILTVGSQTFRSKTAKSGGRNPVWNETFEVSVINDNEANIEIKDDDVGRDEYIGSAAFTFARAREFGTDRMNVAVTSKRSQKQHGIISVSLKWAPNLPAACATLPAPAPQPLPVAAPPPQAMAPAYAPPPAYAAPPPAPAYAPPAAPVYAQPQPQYAPPQPQPCYGAPNYSPPPPQPMYAPQPYARAPSPVSYAPPPQYMPAQPVYMAAPQPPVVVVEEVPYHHHHHHRHHHRDVEVVVVENDPFW